MVISFFQPDVSERQLDNYEMPHWHQMVSSVRGASLNELPRTTTIGPSIFWRPYFSRHPFDQQPPYRFRRLLLLQFSSARSLYIALSSLISFPYANLYGLSLTIRALLHRGGANYSPCPPGPGGGVGVVCAGSAVSIAVRKHQRQLPVFTGVVCRLKAKLR